MEIDITCIRLLLIIVLSFLIGLEREYNHQPAWLRTHILIWLGSTLLMILSIEVANMSGYTPSDPWRIAAQVVSGIWFIGAWAIMRTWLNTKWITTAANIWVTAAIWLVVWAWLYLIAIFATALILFNLIIITKFKNKLIKQIRYCNIKIEFDKKKLDEWDMINKLRNLPITIISKEIKENDINISIKIVSKINKEINIYTIQQKLRKIKNLENIIVSENFK